MKKILLTCLCLLFIQIKTNAQNENPPADPVYDSLSPVMNTGGQAVIWNLQSLNIQAYIQNNHPREMEPIVKPVEFRVHHPVMNLNDSISDTLAVQYFGNYTRTGSYSAVYIANGTLNLPTESYQNVHEIKVTEKYSITDNQLCEKFSNTYSYFFVPQVLKPVFCYSEKFRCTCNGINCEYTKEITRPALDSLNPSVNLSNLIQLINLNCNPNPASLSTVISYNLPVSGSVLLKLDGTVSGMSTVIENTTKAAGTYSVSASLQGLTPGIYHVKLFYQGAVFTKQLIVN